MIRPRSAESTSSSEWLPGARRSKPETIESQAAAQGLDGRADADRSAADRRSGNFSEAVHDQPPLVTKDNLLAVHFEILQPPVEIKDGLHEGDACVQDPGSLMTRTGLPIA